MVGLVGVRHAAGRECDSDAAKGSAGCARDQWHSLAIDEGSVPSTAVADLVPPVPLHPMWKIRGLNGVMFRYPGNILPQT